MLWGLVHFGEPSEGASATTFSATDVFGLAKVNWLRRPFWSGSHLLSALKSVDAEAILGRTVRLRGQRVLELDLMQGWSPLVVSQTSAARWKDRLKPITENRNVKGSLKVKSPQAWAESERSRLSRIATRVGRKHTTTACVPVTQPGSAWEKIQTLHLRQTQTGSLTSAACRRKEGAERRLSETFI